MAQAIYREWSVNFRFPGHENVRMVESELGLIPEGWEVRRLEEIATVVMGQSPSSQYYNQTGEGLPFHQGVTDFGAHFPKDRVYCTAENRVAECADVLVSVRAPVGRINIADKKIVIGRGLSAIRSKIGTPGLLWCQLKETFREEDSMGGGTIFKAVTKDDMLRIKLLCSSESVATCIESMVGSMLKQIEVLTKKNSNLRHTRDFLLPKLVSGEVDVSELDIEVEALAYE